MVRSTPRLACQPPYEIQIAVQKIVLWKMFAPGPGDLLEKLSTIAIPSYAILSPDGKVVASFGKGMTTDTQESLASLTARPA